VGGTRAPAAVRAARAPRRAAGATKPRLRTREAPTDHEGPVRSHSQARRPRTGALLTEVAEPLRPAARHTGVVPGVRLPVGRGLSVRPAECSAPWGGARDQPRPEGAVVKPCRRSAASRGRHAPRLTST